MNSSARTASERHGFASDRRIKSDNTCSSLLTFAKLHSVATIRTRAITRRGKDRKPKLHILVSQREQFFLIEELRQKRSVESSKGGTSISSTKIKSKIATSISRTGLIPKPLIRRLAPHISGAENKNRKVPGPIQVHFYHDTRKGPRCFWTNAVVP